MPSSELKVEELEIAKQHLTTAMLAELSKHTVIPKKHEDYVIDALIKAFNSIPTKKETT